MGARMKGVVSRIVLIFGISLLGCGLFSEQARASRIQGSALFSGAVATAGDSASGITTISFLNPGWSVVSGLGNYTMSGTSAGFTAFSFTGTGTGAVLLGSAILEGTFTFGNTDLFLRVARLGQCNNNERWDIYLRHWCCAYQWVR
jgi:hypothetical protein